MCGRFTLTTNFTELKDRFHFEIDERDWLPRFNIAPSQEVLTVVEEGEIRRGLPMVWGLVPHWAKDRKIGYKMINARAETLLEKPSFRKSFKNKRCLIPADGFYEWKEKAPYRIRLKDKSLFAFAGLWDIWKDEEGKDLLSCTIITTEANDVVCPLHDRMPAILSQEAEDIWLSKQQDAQMLQRLLTPYPSEKMEMYEVSPIVNSWKHDISGCIEPIR